MQPLIVLPRATTRTLLARQAGARARALGLGENVARLKQLIPGRFRWRLGTDASFELVG